MAKHEVQDEEEEEEEERAILSVVPAEEQKEDGVGSGAGACRFVPRLSGGPRQIASASLGLPPGASSSVHTPRFLWVYVKLFGSKRRIACC